MAETLPQSLVDKLEREWRLIDRDRPKPQPAPEVNQAPPPRLKIGRVD
jgi:hypothetical protein